MFACVLRSHADSTVLIPKPFANFTMGADSVRLRGDFGGRMRGNKECQFNGITDYGRVLEKVCQKTEAWPRHQPLWLTKCSSSPMTYIN